MKKEVKIGVFTIIIILSTWGVLRFLGGSNLFGGDNTYYATYENINGVQNSSQIFIRGVKVGVVSDIILDLESESDVTLKLSIESRYRLPKNSEAKIVGNGLMSPMAIEIIIGDSKEYLSSGDTIESSRKPDILSVAGSELESLKGSLDEVMSELTTTLSALSGLLQNNATHIGGMLTNMDSLTYNFNNLLTTNERNIERTLGGFAEFSEALGGNKEQIDSILLNLNTLTTDLNDSNLSTNLGESLAQVNTLFTKINNAEGSIGKIVSDEELYGNLVMASNNLDSLLVDMRQYPSRYIHFSVFGRDDTKQLEKALKKAEREAKKEAK